MGRVAVGLGGATSSIIALGYSLLAYGEVDHVISLRPCKKSEVVDAKRVLDSAFLINPSSKLKKGPLAETQLAARGHKTYVVCLRDPWPMVLDSVEKLVGEKEVVAGDAFCATSPLPKECYASFMALAALGPREGELVVAYPGMPPADPTCVAERMEKAKECFKSRKLFSVNQWEKFKRLVHYVYAKVPAGAVRAMYRAVEAGVSPFYLFSMPCFYEKQEDCKALRRKGPQQFKRPKRPCSGDLMEVLSELGSY